jgi:hypothetical protein
LSSAPAVNDGSSREKPSGFADIWPLKAVARTNIPCIDDNSTVRRDQRPINAIMICRDQNRVVGLYERGGQLLRLPSG